MPRIAGTVSERTDACRVCGVECARHTGELCALCRHPIEHHCRRCAELELAAAASMHPPAPLVTRRVRRRYADRPTVFVQLDQGDTIGDVLERVGEHVERVFMVGAGVAQAVVGWRSWALDRLPRGWEHHPRGHYFDGLHPTLRYRRDGGRPLELLRAAQWFGEGDYSAEAAERAWSWLDGQVAAAFDEGRLLSTPATTARYLFVRSLGRREFPVLPDELQELIRSTSGQGRIEILERAPDELPALVELDGRLMYAGCVRELGHGIPTRDRVDEYAGHQRGRYLCSWRVPAGWSHVGLLPSMVDGGGWEYVSAPGAEARGWVDGVELGLALGQGWPVTIHERLLFPEHRGRPLDSWAAKLLGVLDQAQAGAMIRAAVRSMILHGLGAMHGRPHRVSRAGADSESIPADAEGVRFDRDTGIYLWSEGTEQAWPEMAHPEWSAAVWARARARLLDAPAAGGRAGALHLPSAQLVAFRTDAIYATSDPCWGDDGKVGRFRVKRTVQGPLPRPRTHAELIEARSTHRGVQVP